MEFRIYCVANTFVYGVYALLIGLFIVASDAWCLFIYSCHIQARGWSPSTERTVGRSVSQSPLVSSSNFQLSHRSDARFYGKSLSIPSLRPC